MILGSISVFIRGKTSFPSFPSVSSPFRVFGCSFRGLTSAVPFSLSCGSCSFVVEASWPDPIGFPGGRVLDAWRTGIGRLPREIADSVYLMAGFNPHDRSAKCGDGRVDGYRGSSVPPPPVPLFVRLSLKGLWPISAPALLRLRTPAPKRR
jgi:hypothetical protein